MGTGRGLPARREAVLARTARKLGPWRWVEGTATRYGWVDPRPERMPDRANTLKTNQKELEKSWQNATSQRNDLRRDEEYLFVIGMQEESGGELRWYWRTFELPGWTA